MSDPTIQEIKSRLDIASVISTYIPVKKAGANYKAACPFHNEKTPSLSISPARGVWHCFGCGLGGDIFAFVQKIENVDFVESLKILAEKAGVQLPERNPQSQVENENRKKYLRILKFAAEFYHNLLKTEAGIAAKKYLYKRKLTEETISAWKIGFAPNDYHILERALLSKGVSKEDLVASGVSSKNEKGQVYDRFRGRITFPIFNSTGEVVGFTARVLEGDTSAAKYINSPESEIYHKGSVVFGMYQAKTKIRQSDSVVIVEGQMDCIKAHQAGFENTVATSGTALTERQLRELKKLTSNVSLCFDSDDAGRAAAKKAAALALPLGFTVKIITVTDAKDPDELIDNDPGLWRFAVSSAVGVVEHYMQFAYDNFKSLSPEQKKYIRGEVLPLAESYLDPIDRQHYVQLLTESFSLPVENPKQARTNQYQQVEKSEQPKKSIVSEISPYREVEMRLFGSLLFFPELHETWLMSFNSDDFRDQEIAGLFSQIKKGNVPEDSEVANLAVLMIESLLESASSKEALVSQLQKEFEFYKLDSVRRQLAECSQQLQQAESSADIVRVKLLQTRFLGLSADRISWEKKLAS